MLLKVDNVRLLPCSYPPPSGDYVDRAGTLHLTPHHLIFNYAESTDELWVSDLIECATLLCLLRMPTLAQIPHPLLHSMTLCPPSISSISPLIIRTCTFDTYTLLLSDVNSAVDVMDSVKSLLTTGA